MNTPTFTDSLHRVGLSPRWYVPGAVVIATIAAMTLTACGPRDDAAIAGGAQADAALRAPGQPVPMANVPIVATTPPVAIAPAPTYAPATTSTAPVVAAAPAYVPVPAATYPADPAPAPAYRPAPAAVPVAQARPVASNRVGEITSIEPIRTRPQGSGAGAAIGGVLGAVVGNQFGHGLGRAAMTGAGAVGGALAGNNVERNHKEGISGYRVVVRLENGSTRVFDRTEVGSFHVGDRVRLDAHSFRHG